MRLENSEIFQNFYCVSEIQVGESDLNGVRIENLQVEKAQIIAFLRQDERTYVRIGEVTGDSEFEVQQGQALRLLMLPESQEATVSTDLKAIEVQNPVPVPDPGPDPRPEPEPEPTPNGRLVMIIVIAGAIALAIIILIIGIICRCRKRRESELGDSDFSRYEKFEKFTAPQDSLEETKDHSIQ